jgi:hypothetical protein
VIRAAMLVPPTLTQIDDAVARQKVMALLEDRKVINFKGTQTKTQLSLAEMIWLDPLVGVHCRFPTCGSSTASRTRAHDGHHPRGSSHQPT